MASQNILSESQINRIYNQIGKAFATDAVNGIVLNVENLKSQINSILRQMALIPVYHSSEGKQNKIKGWALRNANAKRQALAARGYVLIFKFREFLLDESINYRYYYQDNAGNFNVREFTESNILKYMRFGSTSIQLNEGALKSSDSIPDLYQKAIETYAKLYITTNGAYMQSATSPGLWLVRSTIMSAYGDMNPGLKSKKNPNQFQVFNRGHIYEAIDTALSQILAEDKDPSDMSLMERYVFGKHLAYDNIKASKGGDNPFTNTSIKSQGADLYDYSTIREQLILIQSFLNMGQNGVKTIEEVQQDIKNTFLDASKMKDGQTMEKVAQQAVEKLIKSLNLTK